MATKNQQSVRLYRFGNSVAFTFPDSETLYISEGMARKLARCLNSYARDIKGCKFTESNIGTKNLNEVTK